MKVLVACEMSQRVTGALLELGVDAWSCDILPSVGKYPERHICDDVKKVLLSGAWGALIAFPPCTHLSNAGQKYREEKMKDGRLESGYNFFMDLWTAPIPLKCLENPLGIVSSQKQLDSFLPGRKALPYTQIVSWEMFGDPERKKRTCLWLQGLPPLLPVSIGTGKEKPCEKWFIGSCPGRSKSRSMMSPYMAEQMAKQWSIYLGGKQNASI